MDTMKIMEILYMDNEEQVENLNSLTNASLVELSEAWTEYQLNEYDRVPPIYREKWQKKQVQLNENLIRLEITRFTQAVKDGKL